MSLPRITDAFVCRPDCPRCLGCGTVCEAHPDKAWATMLDRADRDRGCDCGAPGMPCANVGKVPCGCGCSDWMCGTCGSFDCKWPGACRGKCRECGGRARPSALPNSDGLFDCYCSDECARVDEERARAEGRIVDVADLTPERLNALLNGAGLQLAGVGKVTPS